MARYGAEQARSLANRIYSKLGGFIAAVTKGTDLTQSMLAGFIAVENAQMNFGGRRFEKNVFAALKSLRDNGFYTRRSGKKVFNYSGVQRSQIATADDAALEALATSYGLTQIMGWHCINNLVDPATGGRPTIADLRNPDKHLTFTVQLMHKTAGTYLRAGRFGDVLHIWNTGHAIPPDGHFDTYDPQYIPNAKAVCTQYQALIKARPIDPAANDDDRFAKDEVTGTSEAEFEAQHAPDVAAIGAEQPATDADDSESTRTPGIAETPDDTSATDAKVATRDDVKDIYAEGLQTAFELAGRAKGYLPTNAERAIDFARNVIKIPTIGTPKATVKGWQAAVIGFIVTNATAGLARFADIPVALIIALVVGVATIAGIYVIARMWLTSKDRDRASEYNLKRLEILSKAGHAVDLDIENNVRPS